MKEVARPAIRAPNRRRVSPWPPPMHAQDCGNLTSDLRVVRFGSVCARRSSGRNPVKEQSLGLPFDVEIEFPLRRRGRGGEHDVGGGRETGPDLPQGRGPYPSRACQDCHRPNQVAPFSLLTYEQARKRGSDLAHVTGERMMPPWPASSSFGGPFRDARVLTDDEIATLQSWVDAGCPEGDPKEAPRARTFSRTGHRRARPDPDDARTLPPGRHRQRRLPRLRAQDKFSRGSLDSRGRFSSRQSLGRAPYHRGRGYRRAGVAGRLDAADPGPVLQPGWFGDGVPISTSCRSGTRAPSPATVPTAPATCCPRGPTS